MHAPRALMLVVCLSGCQLGDEPDVGEQEAAVTSVTYHLYNASSPTGFSWWLKTNSPTGPMAVNQWQQQNRPAGYESSLSVWETSPGVPGQSGVLYAGTVITFKLWMRKTSKWGAYNPGAQLNLNFEWGLQGIHVTPICKAFSTAQLTTAQALYTFTCTVSRTVTLMSTDRFALWPMTRVVQQIDSHAQSIELGMQGPNAGTGDSRADIPVAQAIATTSNCPAANPNDQLPDDAALNACLGNGGVVTLANGAPGYIVASGLQLTRNGTTLNSASIDTPVVAGPDLQAPLLRVADGVTDYSISNLSFDGSRAARTHTADCATPATRSHGYNLQLRGSGYVVEHLRSRNALCGAGIEVDGGNSYTIRYNQVSDNGFDQTDAVAGGSADGIALTTCTGEVYENQIAENTEVDLRVGPPSSTAYSYYCHVGPNTITHATRYGRIGELVSGGDHNGGSAGLTTITAGYNLLSVGIMVGAHALDPTIDTLNAGQVTNSDISGPVIGMIIDGVTWGDIARNTVRSVQGYRGLGGCPASLAVVAQHYGTSIGEQTFTVRDLHPGSCSPCGDGVVQAGESCDTDVHNGIGTSACCSLACQQTGAATCTSEPGGGLWPGEQLGPDGRLTSPSGLSTLIYQLDGNLVLYQTDGAALWASGTFGDPGRAVMREDGTLAVYDAAGALQWASAATAPGARLVITENVEGIGDLTIYSADGQTPLWRASDTVDPAGGTWTQTAIEAAALLAGDDSTSGRSTIQTELDRGKAQIDLALAAGQPMNILMKGIRTPDAGLYNSENTMALYDVQRSFADGRYAVVLGNSNGLLSATQPQWGEALTALALIKYAHTRGVPVRVIAHSNGNSSLGGLVEVAATWGLLEPLGIVKKVVMIAPSATDVRLRHIFTAFTTWWNQNQTRVDVIFGDNDNVLDASEMFLGPGPVGINLATGMTEMIISGVVLGAKFGGWLGAGIGAAIGFIVGLFVDSPAERAQDFLEAVEDNPGWFGGWVHVSFINQSVHDLSRYCDNSQTVAALAYSQCVIGSRECVQDCTMTMTPLGDYNVNGNYRWVDMGAEGGAVALDVATVDSCAWQANAWCVLEDPFDPDNNQTVPCDGVLGDQGDANGQADLVIGANSGAARTITIQVDAVLRNGLTSGQATRSYFTVVQAAP